jgi:ATP-dependent protease HslVU (ClpYQ) peptidase subunit
MTTIVYDHSARQIAVDGQVTQGNRICTGDDIKWKRDGDDWWFICGSVSDIERLIAHINATDPDAPKWPIECSAFLVRDGQVFQCIVTDDGEPCRSPVTYSDAMGSGEIYALSALDHGKTAKEAVEYAAMRDTGTGGKITVFDVDRMEIVDDKPCAGSSHG